MNVIKIILISLTFVGFNTNLALAYIGPGLGLGAIGIMLGVIGSIIIAIFALLYYPIKKVLVKLKKKKKQIKTQILKIEIFFSFNFHNSIH